MEDFQLSKEIDEYAIEKMGWDVRLPDNYQYEYEQMCYSYKKGNNEYSIYTYYEADDKVYISCYMNNKFIFEKDIRTLEDFIKCIRINNF
jgi:hypothetical protein